MRLNALFFQQSPRSASRSAPLPPIAAAQAPAPATTTGKEHSFQRPRPRQRTLRQLRAVAAFLGPALRDLADPPAHPSAAGNGAARCIATLDLPHERFKAVSRAAGGTVQDGLVAAVLLGCHRYNVANGLVRSRMRVFCPYGRTPGEDLRGNHWTLVRFSVPTQYDSPAQAISAARAAIRKAQRVRGNDWMGAIARAAPLLPTPVLQRGFRAFAGAHDFLVSNLPGTSVPLDFAGTAVSHIYGVAPALGAAVTATLYTYQGTCHITLNVDPGLVHHPDRLIEAVRAGAAELMGDVLSSSSAIPGPP